MAEDMIERAARAMWRNHADAPLQVGKFKEPTDYREYERFDEPAKNVIRGHARAALLAALDPKDEALVERMARDMLGPEYPWEGLSDDPIGFDEFRNETRDKYRTFARAAIATLKAMAQGGHDG